LSIVTWYRIALSGKEKPTLSVIQRRLAAWGNRLVKCLASINIAITIETIGLKVGLLANPKRTY